MLETRLREAKSLLLALGPLKKTDEPDETHCLNEREAGAHLKIEAKRPKTARGLLNSGA